MKEFNTKEIVNKYDFKFSKRLGQNFLIDDSVLEDIVKGAEVNSEDFIIEIGPGVGSLTKKLLERAKKVCAIEVDNRLIPILEEEFKDFNNLDLINEDALKINFDEIIEEESVKIVANLPYYVTTPIIIKFLKEVSNFKSLTLMIQKEVGDRIGSNPGTKDYGALTILCQYFCNVSIIRKVPANCFIPRPKVDSIVIHMERLDNPRVKVEDEKMFFDIVRKSFSMRRKTLNNCLKSLPINNEELNKAFEQSEIDSKRRAETLTIEEFAILANNIIKMMKK